LTQEQRVDWCRIVAKFPPSHFGADNAPILVQLCRHISRARQIEEALAMMRKCGLEGSTKKVAGQRSIFIALAKQARDESIAISHLSTKLRLTPKSMRDDTFDERKLRVEPEGPKPWLQQSKDDSELLPWPVRQ
jgi:hypothetical protein